MSKFDHVKWSCWDRRPFVFWYLVCSTTAKGRLRHRECLRCREVVNHHESLTLDMWPLREIAVNRTVCLFNDIFFCNSVFRWFHFNNISTDAHWRHGWCYHIYVHDFKGLRVMLLKDFDLFYRSVALFQLEFFMHI